MGAWVTVWLWVFKFTILLWMCGLQLCTGCLFSDVCDFNMCRRRMMSGPAATLRRERPLPMDEKMTQFHRELMETAIDSFSRYTFGNVSNMYRRSGSTVM